MHWWDFWMHKIFWIRWLPVIITFVLLILGTAFFTARRHLTVAYFQVPNLLNQTLLSLYSAHETARFGCRVSVFCTHMRLSALFGACDNPKPHDLQTVKVVFNTFRVIIMQAWRWCFFLGCIPPVYWISDLVVHFLVLGVESTLFTTRQVLYYTYGVRVKPFLRPRFSPSYTWDIFARYSCLNR